MSHSTSHSHDCTVQYTDLHAFERDLLLTVATLQADGNQPITGVAIRTCIREQ